MYKYVILLVCFFLSFPLFVKAHSPAEKPAELTIISISLPPLQYYDESNQLAGYFVDVIRAALATTEFPYQMHLYPWARSYHLAQTKENVCIFSLNRIPERESLFKWVAQLAETHSALYSLKQRGLNIPSLADAKKYSGAAIKDGVYHQLLLRNGFVDNKDIYVVSDSDALVKLFYGRSQIDYILSDDIVLNRLATKLNLNTDAFQRQFFLDIAPLKDYIACSPATADHVVAKLSAAFIKIKNNGVLNNINNKWRSRLGSIIIN